MKRQRTEPLPLSELMTRLRDVFLAPESEPTEYDRQPAPSSAAAENRRAIIQLEEQVHQLRREVRRPMFAALALVLLFVAEHFGIVL